MPMLELRMSGDTVKWAAGGKHAYIVYKGKRFLLPITDPKVEHYDLGSDWSETPVPVGFPILRRERRRLRKMRMSVYVKQHAGRGIDDYLNVFRQMANDGGARLAIDYGAFEAGNWVLEDVSITTIKRTLSNHISIAELDLVFVEQRALAAGSAAPASRAAPKSSGSGGGKKTYTVKRGDTLSSIASKQCGNANLWPKIAEANRIKDPRTIKPGQVLTIPC